MTSKYETESKGYTMTTVMQEAARCLLCHDAPCSQACPAHTNPAKFIRSVLFRNVKGAAETIRENNSLGSICARFIQLSVTVKRHVPGLKSTDQLISVGDSTVCH